MYLVNILGECVWYFNQLNLIYLWIHLVLCNWIYWVFLEFYIFGIMKWIYLVNIFGMIKMPNTLFCQENIPSSVIKAEKISELQCGKHECKEWMENYSLTQYPAQYPSDFWPTCRVHHFLLNQTFACFYSCWNLYLYSPIDYMGQTIMLKDTHKRTILIGL